MMSRIVLVARNVVRGILSRRAVYLWGLAVVLMFLRSAPAIFSQNRDEALMRFMRANAVSGSLDVWALACLAAAMFLGAIVVTGDMTTRTAATVLARPIHRWEFLVGKWIGVTVFVLFTLAIGVVLGFGIARYLGIDVDTAALRAALAQTAVAIVVYSGFAVVFGAFGSAGVAVGLTLMLALLPRLADTLLEDPASKYRALGQAVDYATPDTYRSHYNAVTWAPLPLPPNFPGRVPNPQPAIIDAAAERVTLAGNLAYACAYFLTGCWAFSRQDLPLS
jgi:hypothetical protein